MEIRQRKPNTGSTATEEAAPDCTNEVKDRIGSSKLKGVLIGLCTTSFILLVLLLTGVGYILVTRLGFGHPFPTQRSLQKAVPLLPESALEIVAELPVPAGNIAVSQSGRVFFNFHPVSNILNNTPSTNS